MSRTVAAGVLLLLWLAGLGLLVRREYFRPNLELFAEAAARITPGAVFYGVQQGDRQIGFASSTIDTATTTVSVDDYLVADLPVRGRLHRITTRTHVVLSRALRVRAFAQSYESDTGRVTVNGRVRGDSLFVLTTATGRTKPDTDEVLLNGPILLPPLVPLALALGEKPKVGKRYVLPLLDPANAKPAPRDAGFVVRAESLFVVNDSSVFDSTAGRWRGVQPDTLRAWQVTPESGGFRGWIDDQGRVVQTTRLGLLLRRLPYEVAFDNWRMELERRGATVDAHGDSLAIGATRRQRHEPR